jgi:hypothetical protein
MLHQIAFDGYWRLEVLRREIPGAEQVPLFFEDIKWFAFGMECLTLRTYMAQGKVQPGQWVELGVSDRLPAV